MKSIVWAGDYPVTQAYGPTTLTVEPILNGQHVHCGIDIGMPTWTKLFAARAGRIAYVSYGLLAIETGRHQVDWYVHIESTQVALGAQVAAGDFVAYSGAKVPSGGSLTGAHLHFEVQNSDVAIVGHYDANGRWVEPPGALNNPATSIDPDAALRGLFGMSSQGELDMATADDIMAQISIIHQGLFGGDPAVLTPPIQDRLKTVADQVALAHQALFGNDPAVLAPPIQDRLKTLADQVALLNSGAVALTPAQNATLSQIASDVAAIWAKVNQDLK